MLKSLTPEGYLLSSCNPHRSHGSLSAASALPRGSQGLPRHHSHLLTLTSSYVAHCAAVSNAARACIAGDATGAASEASVPAESVSTDQRQLAPASMNWYVNTYQRPRPPCWVSCPSIVHACPPREPPQPQWQMGCVSWHSSSVSAIEGIEVKSHSSLSAASALPRCFPPPPLPPPHLPACVS